MSTRLIEFSTGHDGSVFVEVVDNGNRTGMASVARGAEAITRATLALGEAIDKVVPAADAMINRFRKLKEQPTQVELEFGIQLSAELGALIATCAAEANCVVRLRWDAHGKSY